MNTLEIIREIETRAKDNQNNPLVRVVELPFIKEGYCYRQGDLYIFKVSDDHPVGKEINTRQLADGVSIGQRHVLLSGDFKVYEGVEPPKTPKGYKPINQYNAAGGLGYVFDVKDVGIRNSHPEHSHFIFNQKGRFQVLHQLNLKTLEKVRD